MGINIEQGRRILGAHKSAIIVACFGFETYFISTISIDNTSYFSDYFIG
jgi:hypothetical protein